MSKLIIAKIEEGTVIDHIRPGKAILLSEMLHLSNHPHPISLATRLTSKKLGHKDILKIAFRFLNVEEETKIALIAPESTISWIEKGNVTEKKNVSLPKEIHGLFPCPNHFCISAKEPRYSHFITALKRKEVIVTCCYCKERVFLPQSTSLGVCHG